MPQVASVNGNQDIGWRLVALSLEALEEFRGAPIKTLHFNPGLLGKSLEHGLLTVMPRRVDHDHLSSRGRCSDQRDSHTQGGHDRQHEPGLLSKYVSHAHRGVPSKIPRREH